MLKYTTTTRKFGMLAFVITLSTANFHPNNIPINMRLSIILIFLIKSESHKIRLNTAL